MLEEGARRMTQGCCGLPLFTSSIVQAFQLLPAGNNHSSGEGLKVLGLARTKYLLKGSSFLPHKPLPCHPFQLGGSCATSRWHGLTTLVLSQGCTPARSKGLLPCRSYGCLPLGQTKHFVLRGQDLLAHVLQLCSH